MSDAVIEVSNISKRYRIGGRESAPDTFVEAIGRFIRQPGRGLRQLRALTHFEEGEEEPADVIWALKDISFEVQRGEVLGVIGRNGAGKSTLLKLLSRIIYPTTGQITLHGRVASLLEVGTGFHPELTGRENVFLNGTLLGMRKVEIDRKYDEIVDFAGVEKFIDTPLKRYSSGMQVRLAFAVAAHLEPDILLVDEVLSVGDAAFQRKSLGKVQDISGEGRTVLFVSHNLHTLRDTCEKAIWLENGRIKRVGEVSEITNAYSQELLQRETLKDGPITVEVKLLDSKGQKVSAWRLNEEMTICVTLHAVEDIFLPAVDIGCRNMEGVQLFSLQSDMFPDSPKFEACRDLTFEFRVTNTGIATSEAYLNVGVRVGGRGRYIAFFQQAVQLSIVSDRPRYSQADSVLSLLASLKAWEGNTG